MALDLAHFHCYNRFQQTLKPFKTMKEAEVLARIEPALRTCLEDIPFVRLERVESASTTGSNPPDFVAHLALPQREQLLLVEARGSGEPRLAREAANRLARYRQALPDAYGVFVAPYISPRAAEICVREGIGCLDLAGNGRISFDHVYIRREGNPNPFAARRDLRSLYSPRAERVLRVLLTAPRRQWKVSALAEEAGVSLGQASNVKRLLENREWLRVEPGGFTLCDPGALLSEWAESYRYRRNQIREFYSLKGIGEIEGDLAEACQEEEIAYALTGFSGAARLAPFVRYQRATAYVETEEAIARVEQRLGLKEVPSGANVQLLVPYDTGVFYGSRGADEARVVAPVQCYLDVRSLPGRSQEAAEALLREVIQPEWERS